MSLQFIYLFGFFPFSQTDIVGIPFRTCSQTGKLSKGYQLALEPGETPIRKVPKCHLDLMGALSLFSSKFYFCTI